MFRSLMTTTLATALLVGCGDGDGLENRCSDFASANCVTIEGGDSSALIDAVNTISNDTTIILGRGTYELNRSVVIRNSGVNLVGQGIDETILDFESATEGNIIGVDVVGNDFLVQDLTVANASKDGIRVEDSVGVTFRRIKATWTRGPHVTNGAYGIYPVKSENVLVEDSVAENASDAGLYVGQCINVIVRRNRVYRNVAGLEIENTQYADVYENVAEDNTAGIVVFDLPGNPVVGRDVRIRDNEIRDNNHVNFAPGGTVAIIPPGTGTFALASRRVEIVNNVYENNYTASIAVLSGLIVDPPAAWALAEGDLIGDTADLGLPSEDGFVFNYNSSEILIAGNDIQNDAGAPTPSNPDREEFGLLMFALYGGEPTVDHVIFDGIGETVDPEDPGASTNEAHLCIDQDSLGILGITIEGPTVSTPGSLSDVTRFAKPGSLSPYDCDSLTGGPVVVPDELP
jgi:parallel beta-helix repeat protein